MLTWPITRWVSSSDICPQVMSARSKRISSEAAIVTSDRPRRSSSSLRWWMTCCWIGSNGRALTKQPSALPSAVCPPRDGSLNGSTLPKSMPQKSRACRATIARYWACCR
ncbi:hypothetical protein ADK67_03890 [Saccharothrix sp. NRRL B-16348]|nr:hypothetical protein ADK67_03890 [Saccharothrix sp. NRRL B-16348]